MQDATRTALAEILPSAASLNNPVDMLAAASPIHYATCLRHLLANSGVDSVLVILPPPPMDSAGGVARAMIPIIYAAKKPVVVALMGERMIREAVEYFRAARVPEYRFPERAAAALAVLTQRADYLDRDQDPPTRFSDVDPDFVARRLSEGEMGENGFLNQETGQAILAAYKIPTPPQHLARDAEEAVRLVNEIGAPVALKIASPDLPHKSDVGGVLLNLRDEVEVRAGFEHILKNVSAAAPEAAILGVYIQPMVPSGQDVIIGTVQDPQFGPLVMFGSGGIEVEGLQDVEFSLAPLARREAEELLDNTWAGRKLRGFRNILPADRALVVETILRMAQLAADFPQLTEIEINPLRVLQENQGAFAVDVRMRLEP